MTYLCELSPNTPKLKTSLVPIQKIDQLIDEVRQRRDFPLSTSQLRSTSFFLGKLRKITALLFLGKLILGINFPGNGFLLLEGLEVYWVASGISDLIFLIL
jgi:hypothetical protein